MPILVHLADEKESSSIRNNGIKIGKGRTGIFCMPVLQNFYLSHQWLRELKRNGTKTFVGVYFRFDSKSKVYAGRYDQGHQYIELGKAIKEIQSLDDPLGYEIIIDRKIEAKEIVKIKNLPQNIGWRYKPNVHGIKPCGCDYCTKGAIKGNRIRNKFGNEEKAVSYKAILDRLKTEEDISEIENLLCSLRSKKRKYDPNDILFLLDRKSLIVEREIALTLGMNLHKSTKAILLQLLGKEDSVTKEFAANSLLDLYGNEAELILKDHQDLIIQTSVKNWHIKNNSK